MTAISKPCAGATAPARKIAPADPPSLPVHRRRPQHRLAGAMRRHAGRQGLRAHRRGDGRGTPSAGDQPQRRLRDRRRALRLGQARGGGGRRRRAGGGGAARLSRASRRTSRSASASREDLMADECKHAADVRDVTPSALGCEECLKSGLGMGASAPLPHLRPCRLLRQFAQPPRHQAFPRDAPSGHRGLRSARRLGLVLRRRDLSRPQRPRTPHNGPIPRFY